MLYGIIDIGSNTIRMTIYQVKDGAAHVLLHKKDATGLVSYIQGKKMSMAGIRKAVYVLNGYKAVMQNFRVGHIAAFVAAAFRNIDNQQEALEEILDKTGFTVEVLSGEDEARLSFIGAARVRSLKDGLLADIGGGSTELVVYKDGCYQKGLSIPWGSLNMYKNFVSRLQPTFQEAQRMKAEILSFIKNNGDAAFSTGRYAVICGVGGTVRAVGKLQYDLYYPTARRGSFEAKAVTALTRRFIEATEQKEREALDLISRVAPYRIQTLLPGMVILDTLVRFYRSQQVLVSMSGVREGYLYGRFLSGQNA